MINAKFRFLKYEKDCDEKPISLNNKNAIDRQKNQRVNIQIMMAHFQLINGLKNILQAVELIHILITVDSNNIQPTAITRTIRIYSYTKHNSRYKIIYSRDNSLINIINNDMTNVTLYDDDSTDIEQFECILIYCFEYCFVAFELLLNCWKEENHTNNNHNEKYETIEARFETLNKKHLVID